MILEKYQVTTVPLLVETMDGEFRSYYEFDPDASDAEIASQLDNFFAKRGSPLFPVTTQKNFPLQFHDYLLAFTFFIMVCNVSFLLKRRRSLIESESAFPMLAAIVNSTLLMILHFSIAGAGFSFGIQYEAVPDERLLAKLGTYTWLLVTPALYFALLAICASIKLSQNSRKNKTE